MMSPVKNLVSTIKYIRLMEKILAQSIKSEYECRVAFEELQIKYQATVNILQQTESRVAQLESQLKNREDI
jgi:CRISPR/Cas system-associated endonuclease Cas3-HD